MRWQAYVRGLTVADCGCFGVYLTQRLGWFVLLQDVLMLVYAVLLLRGARRARVAPADRGDGGDRAYDNGETKARMR
ncbi:hypothetical protein [Streptomyces sp. NBC_00996]|uniref:hypothetical protein n=1 Tax=Streptomyces sp. NBC_00996 TaxID=2903710 RepID=UPI003865CB58|nr:hypothetical protein OG390_44100 [Streptomyces sp. NBC_00996]